VALDAYFATGPAFGSFPAARNDRGQPWVHLITRAQDNYVAYLTGVKRKLNFNTKTNFP
jgi:heat shock protein HspQ